MIPQPDNGVSAATLLFIGFIHLLVVCGLVVLAYAGLSWGFGHGVRAWTAARRRRREAAEIAPPSSETEM